MCRFTSARAYITEDPVTLEISRNCMDRVSDRNNNLKSETLIRLASEMTMMHLSETYRYAVMPTSIAVKE